MAAKSDGAAVSVEDDNTPRSLSEPGNLAARPRCTAANGKPYTLLDCCWVLCALLVFFSDGATDLWLAADYYLRGDYWWFGLTLVFVVVPSAVVQVLSFRWFVYDYTELSGGDRAAGSSDSGTGAAAAGGAVKAGDNTLGTKDSEKRGGCAAAENAVNATPVYPSSTPPATAGRVESPQRCCTVCMWVFQTVLHVLQLGQVWR
ncbi:XK-related protein 7 [Channa argus]|uniref:XK-related protein n=2 Tax=Channa argus TaxID=215402 RepID=A0A6G1Q564_CHAAH|nr:XK-related protein 7 [Channa argus]